MVAVVIEKCCYVMPDLFRHDRPEFFFERIDISIIPDSNVPAQE